MLKTELYSLYLNLIWVSAPDLSTPSTGFRRPERLTALVSICDHLPPPRTRSLVPIPSSVFREGSLRLIRITVFVKLSCELKMYHVIIFCLNHVCCARYAVISMLCVFRYCLQEYINVRSFIIHLVLHSEVILSILPTCCITSTAESGSRNVTKDTNHVNFCNL
jgi:hypothetical protein